MLRHTVNNANYADRRFDAHKLRSGLAIIPRQWTLPPPYSNDPMSRHSAGEFHAQLPPMLKSWRVADADVRGGPVQRHRQPEKPLQYASYVADQPRGCSAHTKVGSGHRLFESLYTCCDAEVAAPRRGSRLAPLYHPDVLCAPQRPNGSNTLPRRSASVVDQRHLPGRERTAGERHVPGREVVSHVSSRRINGSEHGSPMPGPGWFSGMSQRQLPPGSFSNDATRYEANSIQYTRALTDTLTK